MNRTKYIFALFISVLIILTSVVQYHFHDADGNIHLLVLDANSIKPHIHNMSSGSGDDYVCEHHHQEHNQGENSDSDCSAKLGIPILNKEFSLKHYLELPVIFFNPVEEVDTNTSVQCCTHLEDTYLIPHKVPPYIKYRGFRAPPVA